jgi:5-methylcytosine-specific restriction endonuclease McrA
MKRTYDWAAIQRYYDEGHGFAACQNKFGVTHFSWVRAIQGGRLNAVLKKSWPRRYDWSSIQAFYNEGHSVRVCSRRFGFSMGAWKGARDRGEVKARAQRMSIDRLLDNSRRCRTHVKGRLLRAGLLSNRCGACGITEWRGLQLTMHLDHINGVKDDNRLTNLRMLCPNCHSQTETYSGKNIRRKRLQEVEGAM